MSTEANLAAAVKLLQSSEAHGAALLAAAEAVLGPSYKAYEFDTIRKAFIDADLDVPQPNFDRLWAALTLLESTAFFWDARVFCATIRTFAGEDIDPEAVEPIPPVFMGWGIREVDAILRTHLEFKVSSAGEVLDGEPLEMVVASLHDAGFVVCPKGLEWAQPYLNDAVGASPLRKRTEAAWENLDKAQLADTEFPEDEVGVQLARLAGCALYYDAQETELRNQLTELKVSI